MPQLFHFLSVHQNNFVGTLKIMSNAAKNFDILRIRWKRST